MGCHSGIEFVRRLKCATEKLRVTTSLLLFSIAIVCGETCVQVPKPAHVSQSLDFKAGWLFL